MSGVLSRLPDSARRVLREQRQPDWVDPTLATLAHEPFSAAHWLFEPKLDGERCLVFRHGGEVRVLSRNRKDLNHTYPELAESFAAQRTDDFVVDGEIVAFDGSTTSFARLQERMQIAQERSARSSPVSVYCYVFDVVHVDGRDVTGLPLHHRKELLHRTLSFRDPLRETPYTTVDGAAYYRRACAEGWEGVLAKDATRSYAHGRSRTWLKFKCVDNQEFVIGGFTEPAGSRHGFGALLVGHYEGDDLVYAGKVGTGFSERTLSDLGARLAEREQRESPFRDAVPGRAHWVRPDLVAQVEFTEWTGDGKLRHPSFLGLRRDKSPTDVLRERS